MATAIHTTQPQSETMIDVDAVARHFKVDPSTIRRLAIDGKIPAVRVGRQLRFVLADVVEALAKRGPALPQQRVYTNTTPGVRRCRTAEHS